MFHSSLQNNSAAYCVHVFDERTHIDSLVCMQFRAHANPPTHKPNPGHVASAMNTTSLQECFFEHRHRHQDRHNQRMGGVWTIYMGSKLGAFITSCRKNIKHFWMPAACLGIVLNDGTQVWAYLRNCIQSCYFVSLYTRSRLLTSFSSFFCTCFCPLELIPISLTSCWIPQAAHV